MKTVLHTRYGPPNVLHLLDIEKPVPKDDEILVKVHAPSVNPLDWHFMRGTPYPLRLIAGLRTPKDHRLGVDVAGIALQQSMPWLASIWPCREQCIEAQHRIASSAVVMAPQSNA